MKIDEIVKNDHDLKKELKKEKMDANLMHLIKELNISEDEAAKKLSDLNETIVELRNCKNCTNKNECPNHLKGYVYYPQKSESKVTFTYIPCKKTQKEEKDMLKKDASYELDNARMKDIDTTDKKRVNLIKYLKLFYDNYDKSKVNKGLYLHGNFGSGKTFLIACLFNELRIKKGAKTEIIYFPEMLRNLKDDFNTLDSKVRYYSNVELLLIDDIGAEKVTDWSRDEILGSILQSRMNNHLSTFFTSNLTIDELENYLSITNNSIDHVKSRRIIERIKQLTDDFELISVNRRK